MSKLYHALPSKHQWKIDLGLKVPFGGHLKSPFSAMERIGKLIDEFDRIREEESGQHLLIIYQLYRHARAVVKVHYKNRAVRKKLGGRLNETQLDAVEGILDFCRRWLCDTLSVQEHELDAILVEYFGRRVGANELMMDEKLIANDVIVWHPYDAERAEFKLSFRKGLAYRWQYRDGVKARVRKYDTEAAGDVVEYGGSLYVMDARGRIYALGRDIERQGGMQREVVHSSLTGGEDVLAAGTIRIERGQVVWITAMSGHYKPVVQQMVNVLERLRSYQVDLTNVVVYRINTRNEYPDSPYRDWEPCEATTLLRLRRWPGGVNEGLMYV